MKRRLKPLTTDGLSARKDLHALEIREELYPQERPNGKA
jgi:hypothetical protein